MEKWKPQEARNFQNNCCLEMSRSSPPAAMKAISDEVTYTIVVLTLGPIVSVWSVISNVVNIIVFIKMGIKDGSTQSFLVLSISDFSLGLIQVAVKVIRLISVFKEGLFQVALWLIILRMVSNAPLNISLVTTTIIAVIRCLCVAKPLRMRQLLTFRRQLMVIILFSMPVPTFYVYNFAQNELVVKVIPKTNQTSLMYNPSAESSARLAIVNAIRNVTFYLCLVLMFISMVVLIIFLKRASQFREKSSTVATKSTENSNSTAQGNAKKEKQITKSLIAVLLIFLLTNLPYVLQALLQIFVQGFKQMDKYHAEAQILYWLVDLGMELNIGLNLFVYFYFNSRYRLHLYKLFGASK